MSRYWKAGGPAGRRCSGRWSRCFSASARRAALRAAGLVLLVLAPALLHAGVFAWSEPLFSACVVACLVFLRRLVGRGRPGDLVLAAAFASAAVLTRWVGVAVVFAGV